MVHDRIMPDNSPTGDALVSIHVIAPSLPGSVLDCNDEALARQPHLVLHLHPRRLHNRRATLWLSSGMLPSSQTRPTPL